MSDPPGDAMHLHLDCFSGIAGDMMLGALVALGAPGPEIAEALRGLPVGPFDVRFPTRDGGHGMVGTGVEVTEPPETEKHPSAQTGAPASLASGEGPSGPGEARHGVRRYGEMVALIEGSTLPRPTIERARAILRRIGEAEAKIHGVALDRVHFHEVGALDSLVDIVGIAVALDLLGIVSLSATPVPLGRGFTASQHGRIPLPAPATLECLRGAPCYGSGLEAELVTPTGAGVIGALVDEFTWFPPMAVECVGYGAGTRRLPDRPNLLRAVLGRRVASGRPALEQDVVWELAANIDDQTPEALAAAAESLRDAGALDVWVAPIAMKKGRPAHTLFALARPEQRHALAGQLLRQTSSIGLRMVEMQRTKLARETVSVETPWGAVAVKVARGPAGEVWNLAPEADDCLRLAALAGRPFKDVQQVALVEALRQLDGLSQPTRDEESQ